MTHRILNITSFKKSILTFEFSGTCLCSSVEAEAGAKTAALAPRSDFSFPFREGNVLTIVLPCQISAKFVCCTESGRSSRLASVELLLHKCTPKVWHCENLGDIHLRLIYLGRIWKQWIPRHMWVRISIALWNSSPTSLHWICISTVPWICESKKVAKRHYATK